MANCIYLAKLGEINLKKGNLKSFEQRLARNVRMFLRGIDVHVRIRAGRMYITIDETHRAACEEMLGKLIGITGWARADACEKALPPIIALARSHALAARDAGCRTFKIESRRADKQFPLTSQEISREVGAGIHHEGILSVDVHTPDIVIRVEIREQAFVYGVEHRGHRGLPCGCSGRGLLLLSGGIDSPVAGYKMLFRGMTLDYVYFHSYPFTSADAQKKVEDLAGILSGFSLDGYLHIVSFTEIQKHIRDTAPEAYLTLMMRMCMMRIADSIAQTNNARCLITGESLAQVASQTIENISVTNTCAELPVFRPLIGMDKEEITCIAEKIGTYKTSILPYDDCCVLFSPKHPTLYTKLADAREIYDRMKIEPLLQEAIQEKAVKKIR